MNTRLLPSLYLVFALVFALVLVPAMAVAAPDAPAQSDDFDECTLSSVWTYSQGQPGDPPPAFTGSQLVLTAPAGVDHDIWDYGILAQRIMQPVTDGDFELIVKYDSIMDSRFQTRGILIQSSGGDVLRFETHHDGAGYRHYASDIVGGIAETEHNLAITEGEPSYMRVTRSGDTWTHSYSIDGITWFDTTFDLAFAVDQVGPYIGNTTSPSAPGSEPEHVGVIDYFYNSASPGSGDSGANVHELTVNEVGNGTVEEEPMQDTYGCDQEVTLTATPDVGYVFDGWSGDLTGLENPATVTMNADKTITATFVEERPDTVQLDITVNGDGMVTRDPEKSAYDLDEEVMLTATAEIGWAFTGWSGDVISDTAEITVTMDADKSITATFMEASYTLDLPTSGNGVVTADPDKAEYDAGEEVELTATPASGWQFSNWSGDLTGTESPVTITMDANKNILAVFTEAPDETYSLTVTEVGQGSVTRNPDEAEYDADTQVTLTATPAAGWSFAGWSGDATGSEAQIVVTMDANKNVTATFVQDQPDTYTLTVTVNGDGTVTRNPNKTTYEDGEQVVLTATATDGWNFDGWSGDATGSSTQVTVTMDANKTVIATFTVGDPGVYLPLVNR